jgi:hypothetical protein
MMGDVAPPPETPLILVGRDGRRRVVTATDAAAQTMDLRGGMPATTNERPPALSSIGHFRRGISPSVSAIPEQKQWRSIPRRRASRQYRI